MLTSEPGSSSWFERGFVTYSNAAKIELLRVPAAVLAEAGAVSEATARAMAEGGLQVAPVDLVVAVTGIAGPSGGRPGKPVGTVCIAVASRFAATAARTCLFPGDRQAVREQSVWTALEALLEYQK